jgi:23S rRNA pseudouridine2605 synthase
MEQRLQKIIAGAGISSRRAAEEMILGGQVSVNGRVVTQLGAKADPSRDHIKVRGKLISGARSERPKRYVLLNKPAGYLSSMSDPRGRPLVIDLVPGAKSARLHPVGRLDFNSEGLIILTNDGDFTRLLTRAGVVTKVYHVKVKGLPSLETIEGLRQKRSGGVVKIRLIEKTREAGNAWYEVTLREGKNRQIRKLFDSIGHPVSKLKRVRIGDVSDKGVAVGQFRELSGAEVRKLVSSGEPSQARSGQSQKDQRRRLRSSTLLR